MTRKFEVVENPVYGNPTLPTRATADSAGYDFYLPCDVELLPGETKVVWSDIKAQMPRGEFLQMHIRSSVGIRRKVMLANVTGIIDADYYSNDTNDGNIGLSLYNYGVELQEFRKGERIAQGVFVKYAVTDNDKPLKPDRKGGIGSTGR